jgi:CheY-like chemotaxis protein
MDELLIDFLTENAEQLAAIGARLVGFAHDPADARILGELFHRLHAIERTCGLLDLPRLGRAARAAYVLIEPMREDERPRPDSMALVLTAIDRLSSVLAESALGRCEPAGDDSDLIARLERAAIPASATLQPSRPARSPPFSGAANLGDGGVPLALDVPAVGIPAVAPLAETTSGQTSRSTPPPMVLFRSGGPVARALPADAITRIEPLTPTGITYIDGDRFVRVEGDLLPLVVITDRGAVETFGEPSLALVLRSGSRRLALGVEEVVDVARSDLEPAASPWGRPIEVLELSRVFTCLDRRSSGGPSLSAREAILVVEPAGFLRRLIADLLSRAGLSVRAVADGAAALEMIGGGSRFGAVLVDLELAAANDGELTRQIRAATDDAASALIGLAPHDGPVIQAGASEAGLDFAVGKFDRVALMAAARLALAPGVTEIAA